MNSRLLSLKKILGLSSGLYSYNIRFDEDVYRIHNKKLVKILNFLTVFNELEVK